MPEKCSTVPKHILLTGAGGEVGTFLLGELMNRTDAVIYCLVRSADEKTGLEKILKQAQIYQIEGINEKRIKVLIGDLAKPFFGLSCAIYEEMCTTIDSVYNCAANVNFYLPYSSMEATNVGGMKTLIQFAFSKRIKCVYHTSSCSVSLVDYSNIKEGINYGLFNGYSQTKFVSEKLFLKAVSLGLPGVNFKYGYLYPNRSNEVDPQDSFESFLSVVNSLGIIPKMDISFDLTPAEYAVRCMVEISLKQLHKGEKHDYIFYNPTPLRWTDVIEVYKEAKPDIIEVPLKEFANKFHEYTLKSPFRHLKYINKIVTEDLTDQVNAMFENVSTDVIKAYEKECPPCDKNFFRKYFANLFEGVNVYETRMDELGETDKYL